MSGRGRFSLQTVVGRLSLYVQGRLGPESRTRWKPTDFKPRSNRPGERGLKSWYSQYSPNNVSRRSRGIFVLSMSS